jgi:hypothetical protein
MTKNTYVSIVLDKKQLQVRCDGPQHVAACDSSANTRTMCVLSKTYDCYCGSVSSKQLFWQNKHFFQDAAKR